MRGDNFPAWRTARRNQEGDGMIFCVRYLVHLFEFHLAPVLIHVCTLAG